MTTYYTSKPWQREEVLPGVWMSLGLQVDDEVVEVTPRKFFGFTENRGWADGATRTFTATETATFDHIVVSRKPAGAVADVLHNGRPQTFGPGMPVSVWPSWSPS